MQQKLLFLFLGSLATVLWAASLAGMQNPPQFLIIVCALGLLRLSRSACVGGSCLAGLVWDAFDWQIHLGSHALTFGLCTLCLYDIKQRLDPDRLFTLPVVTWILCCAIALIEPLVLTLLGDPTQFPQGWWTQSLWTQPLQLSLLSLLLLPWRQPTHVPPSRQGDHMGLSILIK